MGAGGGIVSGLLANQKEGGKDAGNVFAQGITPEQTTALQNASFQGATKNQQYLDPSTGTSLATDQVQNNPMLSGMFGKGGTLDQTIQQESDQANQPWSLTNEDRSAYGQASGDIARQFGESDQSLAQALSSRGLSNSGAAGAAFSGSQGNKMEQLAKVQQNIAQQRFQSNLQRLGQTQNFLSQMGNQASGNIQDQYNRNASGLQQQSTTGLNYLRSLQGQNNEQLKQQQQTQHASSLSNAVNSGLAADQQDKQMGASLVSSVGSMMA